MTERRGLRARDIAFFIAVSNIHYPVFELLRVEISYGLIPIQFLVLLGMAVITDRLTVMVRAVAYVLAAAVFFWSLSALGVGFVPMSAFVTVMQTATAIIFIDYLLALGPEGARGAIRNVQRLLGAYVVAFAALVSVIRLLNDRTLFNQVAQSNYMGLLTTYLILNLLRRSRISPRSRGLTVASLLVNVLGEQRSSFLLNVVTILRRWLASNRSVIAVSAVGGACLLYLIAGDAIQEALSPAWTRATTYLALIPLGFANIEEIVRYSVVTPESGLDPSFMLRSVSMVYIGLQIVRDPFLPVARSENDYLGVSHNTVLEYFKVGGLVFFAVSSVVLLVRYRRLLRPGYFTLDGFGVLLVLVYFQLFNDLFLGFVLLPIALSSASSQPASIPPRPLAAPDLRAPAGRSG